MTSPPAGSPPPWCAQTHPGLRRAINEDSYCARPDLGLFAVADGLGGHAGGELASAIAVQALEAVIAGTVDPVEAAQHDIRAAGSSAEALFADSVRLAQIRLSHAEAEDAALRGMASTVAAVLLDGTPSAAARQAVVAHVGDSRVYLMRAGTLSQLTRDHSWVEEQVRAGLLTREAAPAHPWRSLITRAVSAADDEVEPELTRVTLAPGDRLLLCSDGLSSVITDDQIAAVLGQAAESVSAETMCESLIHMANLAGGPDNITVIIVIV
jgi:protein phosphatase